MHKVVFFIYILINQFFGFTQSNEVADCLTRPLFTVVNLQEKSNIAAEVIGLNLEYISDEEYDQVYYYLLKHRILVFRNQSHLSVEKQREFTQRFGYLQEHFEKTSHHPVYPDVNLISNIKNGTGGPIGLYGEHVENFHSDLSWYVNTIVVYPYCVY